MGRLGKEQKEEFEEELESEECWRGLTSSSTFAAHDCKKLAFLEEGYGPLCYFLRELLFVSAWYMM